MKTDRRSFLKLLGLGGLGLFLSSRQIEPSPEPTVPLPEEQEVLDVIAETRIIAGGMSSMYFVVSWEDLKQ